MAKPEDKNRPNDPCAADHEIIGPGARLTLRVRFDPFRAFIAIPAADGSTSDLDVTEQTVRYEFTDSNGTLSLNVEPPPDTRVEVRQRTGGRGEWSLLEPITMPKNDRCVPIEYKFWDATQPEPEPQPNTLPQLQIKPRKHEPKTGTSKVKPTE